MSKLIPAARKGVTQRGNSFGIYFTRPVQRFSRTVISLPGYYLATSTWFWLSDYRGWGWEWGQATDAAKHATGHITVPTKNTLAPNTNSARLRNPGEKSRYQSPRCGNKNT